MQGKLCLLSSEVALKTRQGVALQTMPPPGSQHEEIGKAVAPSFHLFPAGLWLGAQGPDPLECGRHEAGVPKARKKVSEPTAAAHFLLDLRGCICEVFGVCGRLKVEGNS